MNPAIKYVIVPQTPKLLQRKTLNFFLSSIRIGGKSINFGDKKIKKRNFHKNKKTFKIDDIDVNKILVSLKKNQVV